MQRVQTSADKGRRRRTTVEVPEMPADQRVQGESTTEPLLKHLERCQTAHAKKHRPYKDGRIFKRGTIAGVRSR